VKERIRRSDYCSLRIPYCARVETSGNRKGPKA